MQKSATLSLRVDPAVKQSAESVLSQLGLSMSTAVDMFLRQVSLTGGIPFRVALPEAPRSIDVDELNDEQLFEALSRGLKEAGEGGGVEASAAFARLREELIGA
ncbi:MAG: type II toxin-antitoxin system RelB/DinJ family antitoxin [Olsenella sp.]|nr:type II toxin-antitoxin system RelB/DinJ family antitoxin [Olsenella sp.]